MERAIRIPFGVGGVDGRTDSKLVRLPKMHTLENAVFTTPGSMRKRQGGSQIASQEWQAAAGAAAEISGARQIGAVDDELLLADKDSLLTETNGYMVRRGPLSTWQVRYETFRPQSSIYGVDQASTSDLIVHAWEGADAAATVQVQVAVYDATTGARLNVGHNLFTGASHTRPQVMAVGTDILVFAAQVSTNKIRMARIRRNGGGVVADAVVDVVTDLHATVSAFDIRASGSQALLAYNSTTATTIKHGFVTVAGVATVNSRATTAAVSALAIVADAPSSGYAVVWAMNSTTTVTAAMYSSAGAQTLAPTNLTTTESSGDVIQLTGAFVSTKLHVLYACDPPADLGVVKHGTITTAGAVLAPGRWFYQSYLASHAWAYDGYVYAAILSSPSTSEDLARQNIYVARCSTIAGNTYDVVNGVERDVDGLIVAGGILPQATFPNDSWAVLSHVTAVSATRYRFTHVYVVDGMDRIGSKAVGKAIKQIDLLTSEVAPLVQAGQCAYTTGGGLWCYDGKQVTESGFWQYPPIPVASAGGAGGSLDVASYGYRVYYEWLNGRGERERSSAAEVTVTVAAGQKVTFTIRPLVHTLKHGEVGATKVSIVVYRTQGGETDAYYRASSSNPAATGDNGYIENRNDLASITWVDAAADSTISSREQDYLSAGELDNVAPAPCSVITTGNGRVFLAGFDDPNIVRYSKTRGTGEPVAFNETLEIFVDAGVGPITGLAFLGDNLVVFRETSCYLVAGDGFDNVGTGTTLSPPAVLSEEIGCIAQRSIVTTPGGVIFQSKKGIYLLGRDGALSYIGADVESYNAQTVYAAVVMPDSEEIRFTMSGGATLLYDYSAGQWSTWTIGGLDACIWRNTYVRLTASTGNLHQEVASQFYDNGPTTYTLRARTGWLHPDEFLQGFHRMVMLKVIGQFMSGHKIQVKVRIDYDETVVDTFQWDATTYVTGTAIYQFEMPMRIQKCEAVSFEFEDIVDGVPTALRESYRLTEAILTCKTKRGLFKDAYTKRPA